MRMKWKEFFLTSLAVVMFLAVVGVCFQGMLGAGRYALKYQHVMRDTEELGSLIQGLDIRVLDLEKDSHRHRDRAWFPWFSLWRES